jgi:hypothetical protein
VYKAKRNIEAGEVLSNDLLTSMEIMIADTTGLFNSEDIGKYALVPITEGIVLNKDMVAEYVPGSDVRYVEYSCFHLSSNIKRGDMTDVRIRYQDGEDMVVLSKKVAEKVSYNTSTCFLSVNEEEQLCMASAICDTVTYSAVLYALAYTEPTVQDASKVTYIPSKSVADIIYADYSHSDDYTVYYNSYGHAVYEQKKRIDLEGRLNGTAERGNISNVAPLYEGEQSNTNTKGNDISSGYNEQESEGQK